MQKEWHDGLVSVIMPAYNSEKTISDSINSVIMQTYKQWELIIVDDCSTDSTVAVVKSFDDHRIRLISQSKNSGVAAARNLAIKAAEGRYVAFLDSDDIWLPDKMLHQLEFMKRKDIAFSYTHYCQFHDDINKAGGEIVTKDCVDYDTLLRGNDIGCLTVMIDRTVYPVIEMPSQRHEDYITWLNLLRNGGRAYALHEDTSRYRKGNGQSLTHNKWRSLVWTWKVYRETQGLPLLKTICCMFFYITQGIRKHY